MLAWTKLLNPKLWLVLAIVAATAGGLWYTYRLGGDAPRAVIAARAAADAKQALHQLKNKERTDAENTRRTAALNRELARLRDQPPRPLDTPPDSKCPAAQICFDGAEFDRARGELYREVRQIAGEGAKVELDLDSARDWANGD
jgi:hypothetical protein